MDVYNKELRESQAVMKAMEGQRDERIGLHGLNIKIDKLIDLLNDTIEGSKKLADENILLQRSVKTLTDYILRLTIGLFILAGFQIYYARESLLVAESSLRLQSSKPEPQTSQSPAPTNTNKTVPPVSQ